MLQGALSQTEGYVTKLTAELAAAEKVCNERAETIASTQQQLTSTLTELEAARTAIKEKDSKVGHHTADTHTDTHTHKSQLSVESL